MTLGLSAALPLDADVSAASDNTSSTILWRAASNSPPCEGKTKQKKIKAPKAKWRFMILLLIAPSNCRSKYVVIQSTAAGTTRSARIEQVCDLAWPFPEPPWRGVSYPVAMYPAHTV